MKNQFLFLSVLALCIFQSCIKDDFVEDAVDPVIRITNSIDSLQLNSEFTFDHSYFNNVGREEEVDVVWESSNSDIISINSEGVASALALGESIISVNYNEGGINLSDEINVIVGESTSSTVQAITGTIVTTTFYELTGGFELTETATGLKLSIDDSYKASTALPGLYIYLSNNRNSVANALEISSVSVFSGAHSYEIENVGIADFSYIVYFCKPFNVKVGEGEL